ncbi:S41 family peptidase [Epilithonimonas hominis]|uniref:S41 family peptidase n=2 Tax=Epilithonimonas hominis TaxID=420404 RepID=UPI002898EA23|nr:S41 family peptidase [Epilithonimonas hominis]
MKLKFIILTILIIQFSNAQIKNSGFESSTNNIPDNWTIKKLESYDFKIDENQKYQGKKSFQIIGNSNDTKTFQSFYQKIPIEEKGVRKIEIFAYIKSEDVNGKVNIWGQVLDKDGNKIKSATTNTQQFPVIINNDWIKYRLQLNVDENAKSLKIGGLLAGAGTVWFDDFEIRSIDIANKEPSKIASDYIEDFKNLIKTKSIFRDKIDWNIVDDNIKKLSQGAETISDTKPAIEYMMNTLKGSGDIHSFIVSKKSTDEKKIKNLKGIEPESKIIDGKIGYIMIPGFATSNTEVGNQFASKINEMIKNLDSENKTDGWIVDLRTNTGGSIYPMILGLESLIGDGTLGYFVTKEKNIPWILENGKFGKNEITQPYKLKNSNSKIAILVGKKTISAGEATAISFIGKQNVKLIGQPTGGFTSANSTFPLSDGRSLALATSFEMDRTGKEYREKINPDILVEPSSEKDLEIEIAKNWILE